MSRRVPTGWSVGLARCLSVIAIAALGCSCGASAEATQPMSGGTRAASASCVGLTARQEYRSARPVFDGKMLPGATAGATAGAGAGEHRVLSSPARVEVTRYLKGRPC